jgi:transposase-like protein
VSVTYLEYGRYSIEEKLRIVEETLHSTESISAIARRNGAAAHVLTRFVSHVISFNFPSARTAVKIMSRASSPG